MRHEQNTLSPSVAWALLRGQGSHDGEFSIPTIRSQVVTVNGPIRFGLGPDQAPRLLVPIHNRMHANRRWKSESLSVSAVRLTGAGQACRFLDILCTERSLELVFAEVAQAIIDRVEAGEDVDKASFDTLDAYRTLFSNDRGEIVDPSIIKGLVGELMVLERLSLLHPDAIRLWQGPAGDRHDFRGGSLAVEVKTSSPSSSSKVRISSFEQLLEPSGGELFLVQNIIEPAADGPLSVGTLADVIETRTERREDFRSLLSGLGCFDPSAEQWNRMTYKFEARRVFRVVDGFPRLSPAHLQGRQLPPGVLGITYDVDLTLAQSFEIGVEAINQLDQRLVACL